MHFLRIDHRTENSGLPHSSRRSKRENRNRFSLLLTLFVVLISTACSPRDFLTRRLAADLIAASPAFRAPQSFSLQTGIISNKEYVSPEYLILQHHGWISANTAPCSPGITPPPCWDVLLTPAGVETIRTVAPAGEVTKSVIALPAARRELVGVTGITRQGSVADVEFAWKWAPMNEVGAALYSGDLRYKSFVGFRDYDDGWRMNENTARASQSIDDALKNAEPSP